MEENYPKINISEIYKALKDIESVYSTNIFDEEDIDHDIASANSFILDNLKKLNSELVALRAEIKKGNVRAMKSSLIQLRVNLMNIASEFDNLAENMEDLLRVLCAD